MRAISPETIYLSKSMVVIFVAVSFVLVAMVMINLTADLPAGPFCTVNVDISRTGTHGR
jgi:hypothetical protein